MKFPNLPAAGALSGAEIVPITQLGVDKRTTTKDIADLAAPDASQIPFANSNFSATNVEDAIVEASSGGGGGGGDFSGPASSTDNAVVRFDGTGGKTGQDSGVLISNDNEISGYKGHLNAQTGTTYTLQASDSGKIVECTNGSAITITLPNSLAVGFCCTIVQGGAGLITLSAASGATLRNRQSHAEMAGQWSGATLYVRTNSGGTAAEYVLNGDTAA